MSGAAAIPFLGLDFDPLALDDAVAWLRGRAAGAPFGYVVTPNVDHMVRLARAPAPVHAAYEGADLCLCDSRILQRIARFYGVALPLAPGSDLTRRLFADVLAPGDRLCLIGGAPGAGAALEARHPGVTVVQHLPPMGLRDDPAARRAAIEAAAAADARFVLLAVGSPQQELLAAEMRGHGRVRGTALCIGASVEFILGSRSRAPAAVQRAGLEWAWRLGSEPRRMWRRYLVEGPAIFAIARRWAKERAARERAATPRRA